jgi:hypothetical protein
MSTLDNFKYVVGLAPGKTSFYDPVSKCNLFLTRKVFGFNIEPTTNILTALKHGTLVDIKGNLKETDTIRLAPDQLEQIQAAAERPPAAQPAAPANPALAADRPLAADQPPEAPGVPVNAPRGRGRSKTQPQADDN